jgi:NAD(P)-dependent dehydrogenase (short-subunit alcohol dehydrogenase family)
MCQSCYSARHDIRHSPTLRGPRPILDHRSSLRSPQRMTRFVGRTVLITGGGRGIGRATALRLASEGAAVAVVDRDAEPALGVVREIAAGGRTGVALTADIAEEGAGERLVAAAEKALGPLDVLVNNAAHATRATLAATGPAEWDLELRVTLRAAWAMAHAALPAMTARGRGAIVNVASVNARIAVGNPAYSAAKAGLLSLTRSIAVEYGPRGVRCNAVSPGSIRTEHPSWRERFERDPQIFERLGRWYAVGRVGRPEEIAACIAFLASDDASFVNGAELVADGGLTAGIRPFLDELAAGAS